MSRRNSAKSNPGGRPRSAAARPKHSNPEGNPLIPLYASIITEVTETNWKAAELVGLDRSTVRRSLSGAIIYPGKFIDGLAVAYEQGRLPGIDLPAAFTAYGAWLKSDPDYYRFVQYHYERYQYNGAGGDADGVSDGDEAAASE